METRLEAICYWLVRRAVHPVRHWLLHLEYQVGFVAVRPVRKAIERFVLGPLMAPRARRFREAFEREMAASREAGRASSAFPFSFEAEKAEDLSPRKH